LLCLSLPFRHPVAPGRDMSRGLPAWLTHPCTPVQNSAGNGPESARSASVTIGFAPDQPFTITTATTATGSAVTVSFTGMFARQL
jgi:hypothetical protein